MPEFIVNPSLVQHLNRAEPQPGRQAARNVPTPDAGEMARLATGFVSLVCGSSIAAVQKIGYERLKELTALLEAERAVPYPTATNHGRTPSEFDDYDLEDPYGTGDPQQRAERAMERNRERQDNARREAEARAAEDAELNVMASELVVSLNSSLTVDDFKCMGKERMQELKAKAAAGSGRASTGNDEWADYDLNSFLDDKQP